MAKVVRRDALKKVPFGNSGMMVTECCLGTMTWGSFNGEREEAFAQLDCAIFKHGVNFIDTAELYPVAFNYGKTTEKWIGEWLAERVKQGRIKRADLVLATKANSARIGGFPDGEERPDGYCYSFDAVRTPLPWERAHARHARSLAARPLRPTGYPRAVVPRLHRAHAVRLHRPLPAPLADARRARLWLRVLLAKGRQPPDALEGRAPLRHTGLRGLREAGAPRRHAATPPRRRAAAPPRRHAAAPPFRPLLAAAKLR